MINTRQFEPRNPEVWHLNARIKAQQELLASEDNVVPLNLGKSLNLSVRIAPTRDPLQQARF